MANNATKSTRCEKGVKLFTSPTNKNGDKKLVFEVTSDMCGKTIKLSNYKK
jgi:hypothetical protein